MNWDKDIQNSLDAHLSGLHVSERQQAQMFNRIVRGEQPIMKKKISAALVFAIVMIAMGSMALAAGLGLFGHFRQTQENNNGARLEKLETLADTYETTKAAAMPTPAVPVTGDTMYDKLLSEQYSHTFELTLDQAYCDGHKLYYSYTLTSDCKTGFITGDGMPTGFEKWDDTQEGKFVGHYSLYDDNMNQEVVTYFSAHPKGYIAFESMGVGDGAAMNGKPLMILDSGSEMVNEYTIQGYQEVEMPDGFEPTDEIEIEMSILYGMSVYCQDENNVYFSHLMTPENRGIFRLPFKVNLNGQTEAYAGSVTTSAYSAQATIRVSDVDISGEVVFDAPEWAAAFEASADGKHEMEMPYINDYKLVADGVELQNHDGAYGVNADGQFFVKVRYDLPESMNSMVLVPTATGIDHSDKTAETENEEIVLMK